MTDATPEPITPFELASRVRHTLSVAWSPDTVPDAATGSAGPPGYGEFTLTTPATGQRFRVTIAELAD